MFGDRWKLFGAARRSIVICALLQMFLPWEGAGSEPIQQEPNRRDQQSSYSPIHAESPPPDPGIAARLEKAAELQPRIYRPDCLAPKEHQEAEFCQIRRSADIAEQAAQLAIWQFFATIFSLLAVIITIIYTRKAAIGAVEAAAAACRAADVAKNVGQSQVRAYIGCEIVAGDVVAGKPLRFTVRITNHGQSPAFNVAVASAVCIRPKGWDRSSEGAEDMGATPPGGIIPPKGMIEAIIETDKPDAVPQIVIDQLLINSSCVFADIVIFYNDVFEIKREAMFRFEFSGPRCFQSGKPRLGANGNYDRERVNSRSSG